jgi:hypothetical protein
MRGLLREAMQGTALRVSMVVWTFGYLLVSITAASQNRSEFVEMLVASTPLWLLGLAQSTLLGVVFERLFSLSLIQRWALAVSAALLAGLVQTAADLFWLRLLASVLRPEWVWAFSLDPQRVMIVFMLYTWSMLMLLGLNWAARSGDIAKLNEARAAAFEAAATRAEIAALRWQLNPHFLFNTLNGIASLVVRGQQERAEDMIERLAQFLRSSLASNPTDLVPLEQEMATIRAYLHIEEARFEDRLHVVWAITPGVESLAVPNFLLQPLVENAIKHGGADGRGMTQIRISAMLHEDCAILSVESQNDRTVDRHTTSRMPSIGVGLTNTRHRLDLHFGDEARLEARATADGFRVDLRLPRVMITDAMAA